MKPGPWWRAQNNCVDSDKLKLLGDRAHRNWFNLVCIASMHDGVLPELRRVAVRLGVSPARAAAAITELVSAGLFDQREDGSFVPHDWDEYQFKNDSSDPTNALRQKKFRSKHAQEMKQLKALRNANFNALRNGVTDVLIKRPETETDKTTTTVRIERGLSEGSVSPELAASLRQRGWA